MILYLDKQFEKKRKQITVAAVIVTKEQN